MKETIMYAKYNQECNKIIYELLDKMSNDDREKDRGSFCGSLSELFRHNVGTTIYFLELYKTALAGNAAAIKAISVLEKLPKLSDGTLQETQWKELKSMTAAVDAAYVEMAKALNESDMNLPVKIDWFGGSPDTVPLSFLLSQLLVHNTHHRGQISQILDSLKIEHDYSGIDLSFL